MSRRKKILLAALALPLAAAALAYGFRATIGEQIVLAAMGSFDPAKAPPVPDYSLPDAWAALPTKEDPADRVPEDLAETPSPARDRVDVFYIHPTGFDRRHNWNATVGQESTYGIPTSVMLAGQASAFNGCGRVYAPEYRQASIFAYAQPIFAPQRTDGFQALDLAYSDVARAFDYFIEHYSEGRPFIIAGHSQGSGHALRLLAEKIDGTPLYPRLIAAYVIGGSVPRDYFERFYKDIKPCTSPTQIGCLIAWDTIREGAWMPNLGFHRYPTGWEFDGDKPLYCVNPLTWNSDPQRAPATEHIGALKASFVPFDVRPDRFRMDGLSPHHTWAQCHEGRLWVADQSGTHFHDRFGVYHLFDYNLFWTNIRENARLRAETYLATHEALATSG